MRNLRNNIYDYLLILLVALLSFGAIGGAFQPIRVFVVLCLPLSFKFYLQNKKISKKYSYEKFLFIFWIIYGSISLLWIYVPDESVKEIIYLIVNFSAVFLLISLSNLSNNPQESLIEGWTLLFLITLPIALYEIWFDIHLPISYQEEESMMNFGRGIVMQRRFASVTYGNLNSYNTLLIYIAPFLFSLLFKEDHKKIRVIFNWLVCFILFYLIISNSSRAAILCLLIIFVVFMRFYITNIKYFSLFLFILIISVGVFYIFFISSLDFILLRFAGQGIEDQGRMSLIKYGLEELINSHFMGIGAGDFMATMENRHQLENTSPHNFFLEVMVQYGLIIFILLVGVFIRIFKFQKNNPIRENKFIIISSFCVYPIATVIDSSYLLSVPTWISIGSLLIIADSQYNRISKLERN